MPYVLRKHGRRFYFMAGYMFKITDAKTSDPEKAALILKLRKDFAKTLIMLLAGVVAVTMAALSFAWFYNSKDTGADGMTVTPDAGLFELGVITNQAGTARAAAVSEDALSALVNAASRNYDDPLETDGSVTGIVCALVPEDNMPLRPGSTGTLEFRIIPQKPNLDLTAHLSLSGIEKIIEVDESITYSLLEPAEGSDGEKALKYLAGHFLFFTDAGRTNLIERDSDFRITGVSESGTEYSVTLYWEWPRTYNDLAGIIGAENINSEYHLYNLEGSDGYNNADQLIGEMISHVAAEISVTQTEPGVVPARTVAASEIV